MTRDNLIENLLYGWFEGPYNYPVQIEFLDLDRKTVDRILEMCLTDEIPAFDRKEDKNESSRWKV